MHVANKRAAISVLLFHFVTLFSRVTGSLFKIYTVLCAINIWLNFFQLEQPNFVLALAWEEARQSFSISARGLQQSELFQSKSVPIKTIIKRALHYANSGKAEINLSCYTVTFRDCSSLMAFSWTKDFFFVKRPLLSLFVAVLFQRYSEITLHCSLIFG